MNDKIRTIEGKLYRNTTPLREGGANHIIELREVGQTDLVQCTRADWERATVAASDAPVIHLVRPGNVLVIVQGVVVERTSTVPEGVELAEGWEPNYRGES